MGRFVFEINWERIGNNYKGVPGIYPSKILTYRPGVHVHHTFLVLEKVVHIK
jgi:hypothetical protein